jgi:uncharacterized phage protein gp47/JayE
MPYIDVTIETEPVDLAADAFGYIEAQVPGWLPSPGNLEAWLIESLAQIAGELRVLVGLVPEDIFKFYGGTIMGIPPYAAQAATATTVWTAIDAAGYTITAGTVIGITPPASQDTYGFQVVADTVIPNGQTTASVQVVAIQPGADASGITGTVAMIDTLDFIQSVTLAGATTGGQDAETADDYLNRLSDMLTLLAPRPILPNDFAVMARTMTEGVARACAVDLYNLSTQTGNQPRCCTVYVCDLNGNACSAAVKTACLAQLQSQREINFLCFVGDPTYNQIDVTFAVTNYQAYDPTDVANRVIAALTNYLQPYIWGLPQFGDTGSVNWINETTLRYGELITLINNVQGVRYVKTLTFGIHGGAMGSVDVALTGMAPLTRPGTITGTSGLT